MKSLIFVAALAVASPVVAQGNCAHVLRATQMLAGKYGEQIVYEDQQPDPAAPDYMIHWQVWANAETKTWTFTGTHGVTTCIIASGKDYQGQTVDDFLKKRAGQVI